MNKKKTFLEQEEYNKFKDMATQLLAVKALCTYETLEKTINIEPESFFDDWILRNVVAPDDELKLWTWRHFLNNLMNYRRNQKR